MLLYNQERKLVAIDEKILEFLGFETLSDLFNRVDDIADLFVNRPGYVYNFKNFSWIDYVLYNPAKSHQAIVETSRGGVEVEIKINSLLNRSGDLAYFYVELIPLKLNDETDLFVPTAKAPFEGYTPVEEPEPKTEPLQEPLINFDTLETDDKPIENKILPTPDEKIDLLPEAQEDFQIISNEQLATPKQIQESEPAPTQITFEPEQSSEEVAITQEQPLEPVQESASSLYNLSTVAAQLEIDESLLKELVDEFIEQAYSYKKEIEDALSVEDKEKLSRLFHKLKGAAINLRISDVVDLLQTSEDEDITVLQNKTERFYAFMEDFTKEVSPKKLEQIRKIASDKPEAPKTVSLQSDTKQESETEDEFTQAAHELGIEKEELLTFIQEYIQEALKQQIELYEQLLGGKMEEFKRSIHKLKGTAANLRLYDLEKVLKNVMECDKKTKIEEYLIKFYELIHQLSKRLNFDDTLVLLETKANKLGLEQEEYKNFLDEFIKQIKTLLTKEAKSANEIEPLIKIAKQLYLFDLAWMLQKSIEDETPNNEELSSIVRSLENLVNKDVQ